MFNLFLLTPLAITITFQTALAADPDTTSAVWRFHSGLTRGREPGRNRPDTDSVRNAVDTFEKRNRLADSLGCRWETFDGLMAGLKNENAERESVRQSGGIVYGPVCFTPLAWYLKYVSDTEAAIRDTLKARLEDDSPLVELYQARTGDPLLTEDNGTLKSFSDAREYLLILWAKDEYERKMKEK